MFSVVQLAGKVPQNLRNFEDGFRKIMKCKIHAFISSKKAMIGVVHKIESNTIEANKFGKFFLLYCYVAI